VDDPQLTLHTLAPVSTMTTMEISNGFLWLRSHDADGGEECLPSLPLLTSTIDLLDLFRDTSRPTYTNAVSAHPPSTTAHNTPTDGEDWWKHLTRVHNVTDRIQGALKDLQHFHHRDAEDPPIRRSKRADSKKEALEKQRERLQKKLTVNELAMDQDCNVKGDGDSTPSDPWIRTARFVNSLTILTPVLLKMFWHEQRNNQDLEIGNVKLTGSEKSGKARCWLFGTQVWDVSTQRFTKSLFISFCTLWQAIGITQDMHDPTRNTLASLLERFRCGDLHDSLYSLQRQVLGGFNSSASTPTSWVAQHPLAWLQLEDIDAMVEATKVWDCECGLRQDQDEEDHQAYTRSINILHEHLSKLIQQRFPDARLSVYGSCLSDLSLGKSSDVDLSLDFKRAREVKDQFEIGKCPVQRYESEMKSLVYAVCRTMERRKHEFRAMQPVTRARVPVIKGTYLGANNPYTVDGSIDFDVCFLNDIAFVNSSLLREYSIVDDRVKALMIAVKRWAKAFGICSSQHNTLSSYAWMNLVIFYLQNVGFVPNLQSPELAQAAGISRDPRNEWHNVNNLDTFYLKWEDVSSVWQRAPAMESVSVTSLLYGFFRFYVVEYPSILTVSIKLGRDTFLPKTVFRKSYLGFWCIEDPFETYDSHCPHDLGIPASEWGIREITARLAQAEQYLGRKLRLLAEDLQSQPPAQLWPFPSKPKETRGRNKKKDFVHREVGKKKKPKAASHIDKARTTKKANVSSETNHPSGEPVRKPLPLEASEKESNSEKIDIRKKSDTDNIDPTSISTKENPHWESRRKQRVARTNTGNAVNTDTVIADKSENNPDSVPTQSEKQTQHTRQSHLDDLKTKAKKANDIGLSKIENGTVPKRNANRRKKQRPVVDAPLSAPADASKASLSTSMLVEEGGARLLPGGDGTAATKSAGRPGKMRESRRRTFKGKRPAASTKIANEPIGKSNE
jgi:DNA polymerase sigma